MADYYVERLATEKLCRCYEIAPPRVRQYQRTELDFALEFIHAGDGFTATTVSPEQFRTLAENLPADLTLTEVDGSSLFCILRKNSGF